MQQYTRIIITISMRITTTQKSGEDVCNGLTDRHYNVSLSRSSVAHWSRLLNATVPAGLMGLMALDGQVWKGVFQLDWTSGHAMRLHSRTGIEGPPVSSLNCDRPLHSGLKVPELVMDAGCRDNRWTASLSMWPPGCSPLVLLPSQGVGSAWVSLSLVGCRCTSTGVFQRNPQS